MDIKSVATTTVEEEEVRLKLETETSKLETRV